MGANLYFFLHSFSVKLIFNFRRDKNLQLMNTGSDKFALSIQGRNLQRPDKLEGIENGFVL